MPPQLSPQQQAHLNALEAEASAHLDANSGNPDVTPQRPRRTRLVKLLLSDLEHEACSKAAHLQGYEALPDYFRGMIQRTLLNNRTEDRWR